MKDLHVPTRYLWENLKHLELYQCFSTQNNQSDDNFEGLFRRPPEMSPGLHTPRSPSTRLCLSLSASFVYPAFSCYSRCFTIKFCLSPCFHLVVFLPSGRDQRRFCNPIQKTKEQTALCGTAVTVFR